MQENVPRVSLINLDEFQDVVSDRGICSEPYFGTFANNNATDSRGKNRGYKKRRKSYPEGLKRFMHSSVHVVLRSLIRVAFVYF